MTVETGMSAAQVKSKRMVFLVLSTVTLLFLGLIYAFSFIARKLFSSKDE